MRRTSATDVSAGAVALTSKWSESIQLGPLITWSRSTPYADCTSVRSVTNGADTRVPVTATTAGPGVFGLRLTDAASNVRGPWACSATVSATIKAMAAAVFTRHSPLL